MEWLTALLTVAGTTIVSSIIGIVIKRIVDKNLEKQKELEQFRYEEERKNIRNDMVVTLKPIEAKIDQIDSKMEKIESGTLSTLRNDILDCYYKCLKKGYRNDYDYQNIHHMYDSYRDLNGNSYVADIVRRFDDLLTKEQYRQQHGDKEVED